MRACAAARGGWGPFTDHPPVQASHRLENPGNLAVARSVLAGDHLPSMSETPSERPHASGSDHAAVVAEFAISGPWDTTERARLRLRRQRSEQ